MSKATHSDSTPATTNPATLSDEDVLQHKAGRKVTVGGPIVDDLGAKVFDLQRAAFLLEIAVKACLQPARLIEAPPGFKAYCLNEEEDQGFAYAVQVMGDLARSVSQTFDEMELEARVLTPGRASPSTYKDSPLPSRASR